MRRMENENKGGGVRKIIQIACSESQGGARPSFSLVTLCDDGTLWGMAEDPEWTKFPTIPQEEHEPTIQPTQEKT